MYYILTPTVTSQFSTLTCGLVKSTASLAEDAILFHANHIEVTLHFYLYRVSELNTHKYLSLLHCYSLYKLFYYFFTKPNKGNTTEILTGSSRTCLYISLANDTPFFSLATVLVSRQKSLLTSTGIGSLRLSRKSLNSYKYYCPTGPSCTL